MVRGEIPRLEIGGSILGWLLVIYIQFRPENLSAS